jgi:Skp family chaperone for outer membrane proteins
MKMYRIPVLACLVAALVLWAADGHAQAASKIGVFDSKIVFNETAEGKRLQQVLNTKRDEYRQGITAKEEEAQAIQQQLREGEFTLSDERKNLLQTDLQRRLVELDSMRQEANNNLRIDLEDVQNELDRKLLQIVEEVGVEQGFAIILEKNTQVVFASSATDISQLIIDRFNQKYPGTPGAAAPAE